MLIPFNIGIFCIFCIGKFNGKNGNGNGFHQLTVKVTRIFYSTFAPSNTHFLYLFPPLSPSFTCRWKKSIFHFGLSGRNLGTTTRRPFKRRRKKRRVEQPEGENNLVKQPQGINYLVKQPWGENSFACLLKRKAHNLF